MLWKLAAEAASSSGADGAKPHSLACCRHADARVDASAASCADPLDVVLCLDGSGSMSYNYPKVQSFAQDFANKFTLGDTETRLAVLRFSTSTVDGTGEGTF